MTINAKHYNAIRKDVKKELDVAWIAFKYIAEKARGNTLTLEDINKAEKIIGSKLDLSNDLLFMIDDYEN